MGGAETLVLMLLLLLLLLLALPLGLLSAPPLKLLARLLTRPLARLPALLLALLRMGPPFWAQHLAPTLALPQMPALFSTPHRPP